jgi:hypothetical protein
VFTTVPVTVFGAGAAALDDEADEPEVFFAVALLLPDVEPRPAVEAPPEVEALPEGETEPDVPV